MVEGRLRNFYSERVLMEQPFVKDDKKTVGQLAKEAKLTIKRLVHWELGKINAALNDQESSLSWTALVTSRYHSVPPRGAEAFGRKFCHAGERGISMDEVVHTARQTYQAAQRGVQIAIVIGGGNILRGAQFTRRPAKAFRKRRPTTWACWPR